MARLLAGRGLGVRCDIEVNHVHCPDEAASRWIAACEHEHVVPDIMICTGHRWRVEDHDWMCDDCRNSAEPHECRVRLLPAPEAKEAMTRG
jgi:hypothetical protein